MSSVAVPAKKPQTERSRALKKLDLIVSLVYLAVVLAGLFYAYIERSEPIAVTVLAVTPLLGLALITLSRGRIIQNYVFTLTALGPIWGLQHFGDEPLLSDKDLFPWVASITIALILLSGFLLFWFKADSENPLSLSVRLITVYFCSPLWFLYALGVSQAVNVQFDDSPGVVYRARVIQKALEKGRHADYYSMTVAPWGPVSTRNELTVSKLVGDSVLPGTDVCITLWPGALHAPIIEVGFCR